MLASWVGVDRSGGFRYCLHGKNYRLLGLAFRHAMQLTWFHENGEGIARVSTAGRFVIRLLDLGTQTRVPLEVRLRVLAWLTTIALMLFIGYFLAILFDSPKRTPMLILSSTYSAPWDINPWSEENAQGLLALDRHNLSVKRIENPSGLATGQWSDFEDAVAMLDSYAASEKPLLIYINLHGVVDAKKRPCLLLDQSVVSEPSTWLPVENLITHLLSVVHQERTLILFFESGRQGIVHPLLPSDVSFPAALKDLLTKIENEGPGRSIHAIASASTERRTSIAIPGGGDPFTYYLNHGLAGECDRRSNGGNANQRIEFDELKRFIEQHVDDHSIRTRNMSQTISTHSSGSRSLQIAWSTQLDSKQLIEPPPEVGSKGIDDLSKMWREIETLKGKTPWHHFPSEWDLLLRSIVAYEAALFGGISGKNRAEQLSESVWKQMQELESRVDAQTAMTAFDLDLLVAQRSAEYWRQLIDNPNRELVLAWKKQWDDTDDEAVVPVPFLLQCAIEPELEIWKDAPQLKTIATCFERMQRSRIEQKELLFCQTLRRIWQEIELQRRKVEDQVLCEVDGEAILPDVEELLLLVDKSNDLSDQLKTIVLDQESAFAELPLLVHVADAMDAVPAVGSESVLPKLAPQVATLFQRLANNAQTLSRLTKDLEFDAARFADIRTEHQKLRRQVAERWLQYAKLDDKYLPQIRFALEELLIAAVLPSEGDALEESIANRLATRKRLAQYARSSKDAIGAYPKTQLGTQAAIAWMEFLESMGKRHADSEIRAAPSTSIGFIQDFLHRDLHDYRMQTPTQQLSRLQIARVIATFLPNRTTTQLETFWRDQSRQARLVTAAKQTVEDFWNLPRSDRNEAYFESHAERLLSCAALDENGGITTPAGAALIRESIEQRVVASQKGLLVQAVSDPQWEPSDPVRIRCNVGPGAASSALPLGTGALRVDGVVRAHPKAVSLGSDLVMQELEIEASLHEIEPADGSQSSSASIVFRGHRFESGFEVLPNRGNRSRVVFDNSGQPSILISDQRPRRRTRMLILDCSASMADAAGIEDQNSAVSGDTPTGQAKLDAARLAVMSILQRWRGGDDWIGVMLYGHRVAIGKPEQGILYQNKYFSVFPFDQAIQPFEDVETILPIGRFDDAQWSSVDQHLAQVVPWGQTPLYLAIQRAIEECARLGPGFEHDVIVISDGRNYQFNARPDVDVGLDEVIQLAKTRGVRLHVIGFGVPTQEAQEAEWQFRRLAEETGGTSTMQIADAVELITRIETIAQPEGFTASLPTGESWNGVVNAPMELNLPLQENTPIWIDYRGIRQAVPISWNSSVQLVVGGDLRLVSARYRAEPELGNSPMVSSEDQPTPFSLRLFGPKQSIDGMSWRVALERIDGEVTQRPRFVWAEITPSEKYPTQSDEKQEESYYVAEANWLPSMPVPVMEFTTERWIAKADRIDLRFWCIDRIPPPLLEIPVSPSEQTPVIGESPDKSFRYQIATDGDSLQLILQHASDSDPAAIVPILDLVRRPDIVERRYSRLQRMSVHRFIWNAGNSNNRTEPFGKVMFVDVEALKRNALHTAVPINELIRREMATLPVSNPPTPIR